MRHHAFRRTGGLLVLLAACTNASGSPQGSRQPPDSPAVGAGRVIDSLLPLAEEIRRFKQMAPETPVRLVGGADSRDGLVSRWVKAIEQRDSLALAELLISPAEFITFYYPDSKYTRPPYRQKPSLRWFLMTSTSSQSLTRVWRRYAGQPLGVTGYDCDPAPEISGANRIWTNCRVFIGSGSEKAELRLFGPILERDGDFKFLTY